MIAAADSSLDTICTNQEEIIVIEGEAILLVESVN